MNNTVLSKKSLKVSIKFLESLKHKPRTFSLHKCHEPGSGELLPFKLHIKTDKSQWTFFTKMGPNNEVIIQESEKLSLQRFLYKHRKLT